MDIIVQALAQWRDEENEKLIALQAFINGTDYMELSADQQMGLNRILSSTTELSNQLDLLLAKWGPDRTQSRKQI